MSTLCDNLPISCNFDLDVHYVLVDLFANPIFTCFDISLFNLQRRDLKEQKSKIMDGNLSWAELVFQLWVNFSMCECCLNSFHEQSTFLLHSSFFSRSLKQENFCTMFWGACSAFWQVNQLNLIIGHIATTLMYWSHFSSFSSFVHTFLSYVIFHNENQIQHPLFWVQ